MREMKLEAQAEAAAEQLTVIQVFRDRAIRWQLISIITLHITQQLCGITAVSVDLSLNFELGPIKLNILSYITGTSVAFARRVGSTKGGFVLCRSLDSFTHCHHNTGIES